MRSLFSIAFTASLLCGTPCVAQTLAQEPIQEVKARIKEISPGQLKDWLSAKKKPILIDVREDNEWAEGHAVGARHISGKVIGEQIRRAVPKKKTVIVLYCRSGVRSARAADKLQKLGYTQVHSLAGGFIAYQAASLPAEK